MIGTTADSWVDQAQMAPEIYGATWAYRWRIQASFLVSQHCNCSFCKSFLDYFKSRLSDYIRWSLIGRTSMFLLRLIHWATLPGSTVRVGTQLKRNAMNGFPLLRIFLKPASMPRKSFYFIFRVANVPRKIIAGGWLVLLKDVSLLAN